MNPLLEDDGLLMGGFSSIEPLQANQDSIYNGNCSKDSGWWNGNCACKECGGVIITDPTAPAK